MPLPKANDPRHLREDVDVVDFEIEKNHMRELNAMNEQVSALSSLQYL